MNVVASPRNRRMLVAGLLLAYLVTRVIRLASFPPFFDEAWYATLAFTAYADPSQAFIALADGKGPLQTWLAMPVLALHVDPLTAVRLVSLAAGAATLLAVVGIARRVAGGNAGLVAGAVYVVLPFALLHDPMGLVDPITTACMAVALYLQVRLAQEPKLGWGVAVGVAVGLGLLTKTNALFALVALPLSLVLADWTPAGRAARLRRWFGAAALAAVIALAIQSVVRLSDFYKQFDQVTTARGAYHSVGDGLAHLSRYVSDNSAFADALSGYLTLPLIFAALAGVALLIRSGRSRGALLLAVWFAGPVVIGWVLAAAPYPRYILPATPAFAVLAGAGAAWLVAELHARRGAIVAAAGVLALAGLAVVRDADVLAFPATAGYAGWDTKQYVTEWPSGNGYRKLADQLEADAPPGNVVVATTAIPPFSLAVLLGRPRLVQGTGPAPIAWAAEVSRGRTTFRLSPRTDPDVGQANLGVFDQSLERYLPAGVDHGQVVFSYRRPKGGTTLVIVRRRGRS